MMVPMNRETPEKVELLPSLTLAYIGDAVYELWVREHLVAQGCTKVHDLHRMAIKYVNAGTQSKLVAQLDALLDEKEAQVLRRGRNAKSGRQPKHMEMIDYRRATGLEALVGYLYLEKKQERLEQIFSLLAQLIEAELAVK
ncbi:hypothetical protein DCMF_22165 [Candidatus Formimonas warabiya]|uniref:Mini-ribonuclease 3 n=1 Tax=Formimonas warabiya TaxID=1761012 RepID=A0A3G1KXB0_FORW1|nr:hypothetical protein DCMF_22165 [Candidatus Formimonas warabiya]